MTRGVVYAEPGVRPAVEEITLDAPGPREVQIRVEACGVCHTDLHVVEAERAREDEPADAGLACGRDEIACPLRHDPLEVCGPPDDDRDEVDDGVDAGDRRGQRRRIRDVAARELHAPCRKPRRLARLPHERAHRQLTRTECVGDVRADEPRRAGDENRHSPLSKFLK